jgi:hypothetical protein
VAAALLGVVVVLAAACGWLAWRVLATRHEVRTAGDRVRAADDVADAAASDAAAVRQKVARLEADLADLAAERDDLVAERDELQQVQDRMTTAQERLERDLAQARADHAAAQDAAAAERGRATSAERAATDAAARTADYRVLLDSVDPSGSASSPSGIPGGTWPILLAILTRRWAAAVGALPEDRGAPTGTVAEQLVEALRRESERLREEVGVDVEVRAAGPVEPADPVTLLLAATDLLGVLATMCERVAVHVDGENLVVTGEGWSGPTDELEVARTRATASGVAADELHIDGERVTVTLRPRATATT